MLKSKDRREMNFSLKFLCGVLCAAFITPAVANVATTAGSNLTAYHGTGSTNNNQWNTLMTGRGGMSQTAAEANFGNCNAVILRCASPKCGSGCTDVSVARSIVAGCVNSNNSCKKHGDDLIEYITAQIVAQSTSKVQEQANAVAIAQAQAQAQADASAAAAAQSNAQMQQMQAQMAAMQEQMAESMSAMQQQMAAQTESQNAQIQSALAEQRNSMANVSAAQSTGDTGAVIAGLEGLGVAEQLAAKNGISADILVREQMGGKIETAIEDAMTAMKDLKTKLDAVLEYAGCDSSATNCTGPKRVKKFKDLANEFFDPYENVVENVYDALMLAMTLGIDVNDVIMLLSNSCNIWGKYMCSACNPKKDADCVCNDTKNDEGCYYRVKTDDATGKVSKNQPHCRLVDTLTEKDTVWREWIDANTGMTGSTQVACASDVIMDISLFRGMKKEATLDIDNLRRLVNQDSRSCRGKMDGGKFVLDGKPEKACWLDRCAVTQGSPQYDILARTVDSRKLPTKTSSNGTATDVLCYTNEDRLPDIEGTNIELPKFDTKITTGQTWANTFISNKVGSNIGEEEAEMLRNSAVAEVKCYNITIPSLCKDGCKWDIYATPKCQVDIESSNSFFQKNVKDIINISGGISGI
ncbi:MAG: hypothetical protein IJQ90_04815 [Alphaproteobacteria bacterium]|nr:hypothetical protein [Alphaproteobacteria bacterium]